MRKRVRKRRRGRMMFERVTVKSVKTSSESGGDRRSREESGGVGRSREESGGVRRRREEFG